MCLYVCVCSIRFPRGHRGPLSHLVITVLNLTWGIGGNQAQIKGPVICSVLIAQIMKHQCDLINIWAKSRAQTSACLLATQEQGRLYPTASPQWKRGSWPKGKCRHNIRMCMFVCVRELVSSKPPGNDMLGKGLRKQSLSYLWTDCVWVVERREGVGVFGRWVGGEDLDGGEQEDRLPMASRTSC